MTTEQEKTPEAGDPSRCGYVGLVGRPNAGKSTLLNRLIGKKIAIVSDKPQTTRHRILGIRTRGQSQIIFVDTPGIHRPGYRLNERMMDAVYGTLKEVDVVVHLVEVFEKFGKGAKFAVDLMRTSASPVILALNKVDAVNKGKILPVIESYAELGVYAEIVPLSAQTGDNLDALLEAIGRQLPEGDFLFPLEQFTDQRERSRICEIIREKVLRNTRQELPYSTAVRLDLFDESERYPESSTSNEEGSGPRSFVHIVASIIVDKGSQKKIVIGRGGQMIKKIGTEARKDLLKALEVEKIYLELNVKVVANWRNTDHLLDELGVH